MKMIMNEYYLICASSSLWKNILRRPVLRLRKKAVFAFYIILFRAFQSMQFLNNETGLKTNFSPLKLTASVSSLESSKRLSRSSIEGLRPSLVNKSVGFSSSAAYKWKIKRHNLFNDARGLQRFWQVTLLKEGSYFCTTDLLLVQLYPA